MLIVGKFLKKTIFFTYLAIQSGISHFSVTSASFYFNQAPPHWVFACNQFFVWIPFSKFCPLGLQMVQNFEIVLLILIHLDNQTRFPRNDRFDFYHQHLNKKSPLCRKLIDWDTDDFFPCIRTLRHLNWESTPTVFAIPDFQILTFS